MPALAAEAGCVTAWRAIWAPNAARTYWELTVTDENGNVAMTDRSDAPVLSPRPRDKFLVAIGLCPVGDWEPGEGGSVSCEVLVVSKARRAELIQGLLARGRSDPGVHVR